MGKARHSPRKGPPLTSRRARACDRGHLPARCRPRRAMRIAFETGVKVLESPASQSDPAIALPATSASAAALSVTPSDLAWRVIGLLNLYRLLVPLVLLAMQSFAGAGWGLVTGTTAAVRRRLHRVLHGGRAAGHRPAAALVEPADRRARQCQRRCARHRLHSLRERRRRERARDPAGAAGIRADRARRPARCAAHRGGRSTGGSAAAGLRRPQRQRADYRLRDRRSIRRGAVPGRAGDLAGGQPPARERSAGAPSGGRPRQHGAALAVHRAAPARKHPGGRRAGSHPAHQRVGGADARRRARLSRCADRRGLAPPALPARVLAQERRPTGQRRPGRYLRGR